MRKKAVGLMLMACLWICCVGVVKTTAHAAERGWAYVPVTIFLDGAVPEQEECFFVELIPEDKRCPMPEECVGKVFQLAMQGESTEKIRIPCDRMGVYCYKLRLAPGENPDCSYDVREYNLTLYVTNGEDGETVTTVLAGPDGGKEAAAVFRNVYAFPDTVTLTAIKTMDGKTPDNGAFSFLLLAEDGTRLDRKKNVGRTVTFDPLTFAAEGTYVYYLKEVNGHRADIIYDTAVYTITVQVTRDVDYHAEVTMKRNREAYTGTPVFKNRTDTGSPQTGDSIGIYTVVLLASAAGLSMLLMGKRRK